MTSLSAQEHSILSQSFGYLVYDLALRAMEAYGDEYSAHLWSAFRSEWESEGTIPDLSHNNRYGHVQLCPTAEDVIGACSGLIEAYDKAREISERSGKLQLRRTVEALFELRAFARLNPSTVPKQETVSLRESLLSRELSSFPLNTGQVSKLKKGGYVRLRDLNGEPMPNIVGKCGLNSKQVENIDTIIENYIKIVVSVSEIGYRRQMEAIGKALLGDKFSLVERPAEFWFSQYILFSKETASAEKRRTTKHRSDVYGIDWVTYGWETWLTSLDDQPAAVFIRFKKWLKLVAEWNSPTKPVLPSKAPGLAKKAEDFEKFIQSPSTTFFQRNESVRDFN